MNISLYLPPLFIFKGKFHLCTTYVFNLRLVVDKIEGSRRDKARQFSATSIA